jgi:hypothetical protein
MNPAGPVIATPTSTEPSDASKHLLPWLVAVAFFMESLDTTILNTAVPAISSALGVAPLSMKSVLASYTLSLAVFIPISGWMADRFGTRRVFASAIGLFTLGSCLCGISSNIHLLVACRILQGCGGAMMVPVGRLTLVRTFAKSDLLRTMSFVSIPALVAPMLGPIAGGLIVGYGRLVEHLISVHPIARRRAAMVNGENPDLTLEDARTAFAFLASRIAERRSRFSPRFSHGRLLITGECGPRCDSLQSPHRDRCPLLQTSSLNCPLPQTHALQRARKAPMSVSGRSLPPSPAPISSLRTMFPTSLSGQSPVSRFARTMTPSSDRRSAGLFPSSRHP